MTFSPWLLPRTHIRSVAKIFSSRNHFSILVVHIHNPTALVTAENSVYCESLDMIRTALRTEHKSCGYIRSDHFRS